MSVQGGDNGSEPKKVSGTDMAKIFGPAVIQATGNIIGGYFSGKGSSNTKVEEKVNRLKDSSWFHWILLIGISVIALGAFIDGLQTMWKLLSAVVDLIPGTGES